MSRPTAGTVRVAGLLAGFALLGTLLLAAGHVLYYLYYWEWVRAQIALTVLVAALVIGATTLVLRRIDRAEQAVHARLDELAARLAATPAPAPAVAAPQPPAVPLAPEPPAAAEPRFPWLDPALAPGREALAAPALLAATAPATPAEPRLAVFIPVLLGAGLVVSVVAGLVEVISTRWHDARRARTRSTAREAAAVAVVTAVIGAGLWTTAHYDPPPPAAGRTELVVDVDSKSAPAPPAATVDVVGRYCARNAISGFRVAEVRPRTGDTAVLVVTPMLDPQSRRRLGGCLEDAVLFRHRFRVVGTSAVPAGRSGAGP
jgi:hypothetical protein